MIYQMSHDSHIPYETVTVTGLLLFIMIFPIIIMNLLIGLAVDDIKTVMANAKTKKIIQKVLR